MMPGILLRQFAAWYPEDEEIEKFLRGKMATTEQAIFEAKSKSDKETNTRTWTIAEKIGEENVKSLTFS